MAQVREQNGRKIGIITVDLTELIDLDPDTLMERFSYRLVGNARLVDLQGRST